MDSVNTRKVSNTSNTSLSNNSFLKHLLFTFSGTVLMSLCLSSPALAEEMQTQSGVVGTLHVAEPLPPEQPAISTENMQQVSASIQEWDTKCAAGDMNSCVILSQVFLEQKLYPQASNYLEKVCYSNTASLTDSSKACAALTYLLIEDSYQMLNLAKGQEVARYLCEEKEVATGCIALSQLYLRPELTDANKSFEYAQKACELNDATGCKQVALTIYSQAYGQRNLEKAALAFEFYKKACELGDADSCATYAPHEEKLEQFRLFIERTQKQTQ